MRTFFESIEGKIRNELASAIDYRMLSVCFIHLFRNRKIVHKENLIGNLSLPVSLSLFDVEKPRPTPFLAGRSDPLRVLRSGRIGQRRCFLFLRAADCLKMIGENGGAK